MSAVRCAVTLTAGWGAALLCPGRGLALQAWRQRAGWTAVMPDVQLVEFLHLLKQLCISRPPVC